MRPIKNKCTGCNCLVYVDNEPVCKRGDNTRRVPDNLTVPVWCDIDNKPPGAAALGAVM